MNDLTCDSTPHTSLFQSDGLEGEVAFSANVVTEEYPQRLMTWAKRTAAGAAAVFAATVVLTLPATTDISRMSVTPSAVSSGASAWQQSPPISSQVKANADIGRRLALAPRGDRYIEHPDLD